MRQWLLKQFPADSTPMRNSPPMRLGQPTPEGEEMPPLPLWAKLLLIVVCVVGVPYAIFGAIVHGSDPLY